MKRIFLLILLCTGSFFCTPAAKAEPVTMVILAPIALEGAKQASPYVIASMQSGGQQLLEVGRDIGNILRLPLGLVQITLGLPFGLLGDGINNIGAGLWAPFQLAGDLLILPISFFPSGGG